MNEWRNEQQRKRQQFEIEGKKIGWKCSKSEKNVTCIFLKIFSYYKFLVIFLLPEFFLSISCCCCCWWRTRSSLLINIRNQQIKGLNWVNSQSSRFIADETANLLFSQELLNRKFISLIVFVLKSPM